MSRNKYAKKPFFVSTVGSLDLDYHEPFGDWDVASDTGASAWHNAPIVSTTTLSPHLLSSKLTNGAHHNRAASAPGQSTGAHSKILTNGASGRSRGGTAMRTSPSYDNSGIDWQEELADDRERSQATSSRVCLHPKEMMEAARDDASVIEGGAGGTSGTRKRSRMSYIASSMTSASGFLGSTTPREGKSSSGVVDGFERMLLLRGSEHSASTFTSSLGPTPSSSWLAQIPPFSPPPSPQPHLLPKRGSGAGTSLGGGKGSKALASSTSVGSVRSIAAPADALADAVSAQPAQEPSQPAPRERQPSSSGGAASAGREATAPLVPYSSHFPSPSPTDATACEIAALREQVEQLQMALRRKQASKWQPYRQELPQLQRMPIADAPRTPFDLSDSHNITTPPSQDTGQDETAHTPLVSRDETKYEDLARKIDALESLFKLAGVAQLQQGPQQHASPVSIASKSLPPVETRSASPASGVLVGTTASLHLRSDTPPPPSAVASPMSSTAAAARQRHNIHCARSLGSLSDWQSDARNPTVSMATKSSSSAVFTVSSGDERERDTKISVKKLFKFTISARRKGEPSPLPAADASAAKIKLKQGPGRGRMYIKPG
ncbi:hypothetical protein K437DRAFT_265103 [Tilletiaria anomala UBC 951]|uniref:Uncharacterized protein n=1 Tax=Tilletiaria anomala (strain ATCC 24038 / CBS 436.72 / UBC 951) TaxID=1037660 RepID=A0A066V660_TILAU|nr:uncharacterized protein K437DRAFT_265103 [Tilletiaria anomala UBC 951]KDN37237.1 hypothetical protein K437DRAFT_265103 [Tilletiaria anomala UBC 951]